MHIPNVTFTGVDFKTSVNDLISLAEEFPAIDIEFAFLFSSDRAGKQGHNRYPSGDFITKSISELKANAPSNLSTSVHLCGSESIVRTVLGGYVFNSDRIQLNLPRSWEDFLPFSLLFKYIENNSKTGIITQYKPSSEDLYKMLSYLPNHQVLFDSSGGTGVSPTSWPSPLDDTIIWGYAGGLSPENIASQYSLIRTAFNKTANEFVLDFWVDMETGVRDSEDIFSIDKCRTVLQILEASAF